MASFLKYEFQKKHFVFSDASAKDFYESQWFGQRSIFVAYRFVFFTYCLMWNVVNRMYYDRHFAHTVPVAYLSNWGEWLQTTYFCVALVIALYGLVTQEDMAVKDRNLGCCRWNQCNRGDLRWFHHLQWILFSTSTPFQYCITIMYWSVANDGSVALPVSLHQHLMNSILATIDLFMCRVPVRILHFVYSACFALFYILLTLALHEAGIQSKIYEGVLDWQNYPAISAGVSVGTLILSPLITQSIVFGLYQLRKFIARKVMPNQEEKAYVADEKPESGEAELFQPTMT